MNFKDYYFAEGLVKVPESLTENIMAWTETVYYAFQWFSAHTANDFMGRPVDRTEIDRFYEKRTERKIHDKIEKQYGNRHGAVFLDKSFMVTGLEYKQGDIPDSLPDDPIPFIQIYLHISNFGEFTGEFSTAKHITVKVPEKELKTYPMRSTMKISAQAFKKDLLESDNDEKIKWALQQTRGTLSHELTHFIEYLIRGREEWMDFAGDATSASSGFDYVLNPSEFEPLLQEIFAIAQNIVDESGPLSKDEFRHAMDGHWKDVAGNRGVSAGRIPDQRLRIFKAESRDEWNRAVQKLFNALQEREMFQ